MSFTEDEEKALFEEMMISIRAIQEETNLQENIEDISLNSLILIVQSELDKIKRLKGFLDAEYK